jgi:hypothetical protein
MMLDASHSHDEVTHVGTHDPKPLSRSFGMDNGKREGIYSQLVVSKYYGLQSEGNPP